MSRQSTGGEPEQDIGTLADLPRADLVEHWKGLYRADPPKGISTRIMMYGVAYGMQARAHGRLPRSIMQKLREIGSPDAGAGKRETKLSPGTRLVREWQGTVHVVDVIEEGFRWQGRAWPSLSVIAREITGTRWSGPRFFGLKTRSGRAVV